MSRSDAPARGLAAEATSALSWSYLSFASGRLLVMVTMAVLARVLTPQEFGIAAFATLVVAYLSVLTDLGFGAALIQRRDDVDEAADTVFTINVVLGALLTAVTFIAAPLVADFFREPMVVPLLRVLSLTFILESLGSVQLVMLRKQLAFRRKLVPDLGRAIVKGVVAISAAAAGLGAWALVWGQLAGVTAAVVLAWVVTPSRPRLRIHRKMVRPLGRFGAPLVVTDIQYAIWLNLDYVVVGRMLGDVALGVYTLAYRLPELLIQSVWRVLATTLFPLFSRVQDRMDLLRQGYLASVRYTQTVIVPMCIGMFITAEPIVLTVFGPQWSEAVPVLRVMAVFSLVTSIGVNAGDVYKALGRTGVLARLATLELFILVPALVWGARWGIVGVAWAHAIVAAVDASIRLVVANRILGTTFTDIGRQLKPSFLSGAWLAMAALPALWLGSAAGALVGLGAAVVAGAAAYWVALHRFDPEVPAAVSDWLRRRGSVA